METLSSVLKRIILALFWLLLVLIILMAFTIFTDDPFEILGIGFLADPFLILVGSLSVTALLLFVLTVRAAIQPKLKRFLLLTAGAVLGVTLSIVLHNLLYAAAIMVENMRIVHALASMLEVAFFLLSIFIFPLAFLIGAIGVIVVLLRAGSIPQPPANHPTTVG